MLQRRIIILVATFLIFDALLMLVFSLGSPTKAAGTEVKSRIWKAIYKTDPVIQGRLTIMRMHVKPENLTSEECIACHGDMKQLKRSTNKSNLKIDVHFHLTLPVANFTCTDCHRTGRVQPELSQDIGKKQAGQAGSALTLRINRFFCFKCHSSFEAYVKKGRMKIEYMKEDCQMCHRGKMAPRHEQPFLSQVLSTTECLMCHGNNIFPWPKQHYDKAWKTSHGLYVKNDPKVCQMCHAKPTFCDKCHTVKPITHDGGWRGVHATNYKQRPERCKTCHTDKFCNEKCHLVNHTAGWRNDHGPHVVEKGRDFCMNCHYLGYCFRCHNTTNRKIPSINFSSR